MINTRTRSPGAVGPPTPNGRASWTRQQVGDGSISVPKGGVVGFDPQRFRAVREQVGLKQQQLAERLLRARRPDWPGPDVPKAALELENLRKQVGDYETGRLTPGPGILYRLAQFLEADPLDMLDPQTPYTLEVLRVRRGLRQADVVERGLDVTTAYYGRIERGKAKLSDERRARLAEILDVDLADLDDAIAGGHTVGSMITKQRGEHTPPSTGAARRGSGGAQ
jgi:transcriptional regulator with XRE-family HTH domain